MLLITLVTPSVLSVSAACNDELLINSVLTAAASVKGNMGFILFLSVVGFMDFDTAQTVTLEAVSRYGV